MNGENALEQLFELMVGILNASFEEQHLVQINFLFYMLETSNFLWPNLNVHNITLDSVDRSW